MYDEMFKTVVEAAKVVERHAVVKMPELCDEFRKTHPEVGADEFKVMLQRWQREDRLVLQLCNDRRTEPRAEEGLWTERGLRFYVQLLD